MVGRPGNEARTGRALSVQHRLVSTFLVSPPSRPLICKYPAPQLYIVPPCVFIGQLLPITKAQKMAILQPASNDFTVFENGGGGDVSRKGLGKYTIFYLEQATDD